MSSRLNISKRMREVLSFIPCAIFPALITPMVFFHQGQSHFFLQKERLFALFVASFISYKTKNILITIVCGLLLLFVFSIL
ncbi:AzlD domain-containing protein [Bacteriovorax sp. DB6_IX]|uniref:AzlD domain-containing protein n=1 Tax=Bacteriovorax sp. DB6_IX TaxID=1353530 RepID=UPI00350FDD01